MTAGVRWQDMDVPDPGATQPPYAIDPDLLTEDRPVAETEADQGGQQQPPVTPVSVDDPDTRAAVNPTAARRDVVPMIAGAGLLVVGAGIVVAVALVLMALALTLS